VNFPDYFFEISITGTKYILASDQLADILPATRNDIGFNHTHPHFDPCDDSNFLFTSGMAISPPRSSQYINVEPEEEGMYSGDGDTTIRANEGADILRVLKRYQ
jgi:hypothetical protein